jgi:hypothetical protein
MKEYADGLAIAGSPDASTTVKGITKLSTAPVSATQPIAVGDNDTRVPSQSENDALVGTSGTPSSSNKFVTNDDTAATAASAKVARRNSAGDLTVNVTPTNSTDAASKSYVDSAVVKKLSIVATDVDYINSITETDILSVTLPGGKLGTGNGVRARFYIEKLDTLNADARTLTLKLKYGATTIATISGIVVPSSAVDTATGYIEAVLISRGSTSTQEGSISIIAMTSNPATNTGICEFAVGTAAEDSTANKTLAVTAQWGGGAANASELKIAHAIVELIN